MSGSTSTLSAETRSFCSSSAYSNLSNGSAALSATSGSSDNGTVAVYVYTKCEYERFPAELICEELCKQLCRRLNILPTTQLLFGICVRESFAKEPKGASGSAVGAAQQQQLPQYRRWVLPCEKLQTGLNYAFRLRFRVPDMNVQLRAYDAQSHDYLYYQMRHDMRCELIPGMRYPAKRDKVAGLAIVDMQIDLLLNPDKSAESIRSDYKRYLPGKLVRKHGHGFFLKPKILKSFESLRAHALNVDTLKWHYVHEICTLSPSYLLERYRVLVDYMPDELSSQHFPSPSTSTMSTTLSALSTLSLNVDPQPTERDTGYAYVYVQLLLNETAPPTLQIAQIAADDNLNWLTLASAEDIFVAFVESGEMLRLEIRGYPRGYRMHFDNDYEMKSFISYLGTYIRLTTKWMFDLCVCYQTPSLKRLKQIRCHGPIGGSYSFMKIGKHKDACGSYITRQCEKEYDVYYIDINRRSSSAGTTQFSDFRTETFKITYVEHKWQLHYKDELLCFDQLSDLAQFIPTKSEKFRIPPSEYDKPPLLLIGLSRKSQTKKTETELSETFLQRGRAQIFDHKSDLQWYFNTSKKCCDGKTFTVRADWIQNGSYKDVPVTMKVLLKETDFIEFTKLANEWCLMTSPQLIKGYGITLCMPYTIVMEHAEYGPLNEFLRRCRTATLACLLDAVHGLVRGVHYLHGNGFIHNYIRCSNIYVTKFDSKLNLLETKISDPGLQRPYTGHDLPWLPFEYYNDIQSAKQDPVTQLWAFATTMWEIFARGRPVSTTSAEKLRLNYNTHGGILEQLSEDICPREMYETMMDGWSTDPDSRFDHQEIFSRLNEIQNRIASNYIDVEATAAINEHGDLAANYSFGSNASGDRQSLACSDASVTPLLEMNSAANGFSGYTNRGAGSPPDSNCSGSNGSIGTFAGAQTNASKIRQQPPAEQSESFSSLCYFPDTPTVLQVDDGKIIYKEKDKIGQGHYGTVYRGELRFDDPQRPAEKVAIKKLKSQQMKRLNDDFKREIDIMKTLSHPNIVQLKYWIHNPFSIIMEFFEHGSFTVYLSSQKPNLTNSKLLRFGLDIAEGMRYLRQMGIIHRDLAARNILVDRDCVKISDFGLAQIADSDGYYFARSVREIPIKWYSPESIKTSKFSFQSDVWSYGVTLFEMFSRGEVPNLVPGGDITQEDFLNLLERGKRLQQPAQCPDIVYFKLMRPCWHHNPKMRPTFSEIIETIKEDLIENLADGNFL